MKSRFCGISTGPSLFAKVPFPVYNELTLTRNLDNVNPVGIHNFTDEFDPGPVPYFRGD